MTSLVSRFVRIKKPITGLLFAVCTCLTGAAVRAESAPALSEADAIRLALQRKALAQVLKGAEEIERGRAETEGAWPNPELSFTREQTFGPRGTRDDYVVLSQQLDIAGRRSLRAQAAEARAKAVQGKGRALHVTIAAEVREKFFVAVHSRDQVGALRDWKQRIGAALEVVARRERRGEAAQYDRTRLGREDTLADAKLQAAVAADARKRAELRTVLGVPLPQSLVGLLLPPKPQPSARLQAGLANRQDLQALRLQLHAATLEQKAASRWWVPDLRLDLGWKGTDLGEAGRTDGFVLGAALTLPLWNQSAGYARSARGEAAVTQGTRELKQSAARHDLEAARAEALKLRSVAVTFRTKSTKQNRDLLRMAERGYEAGELGLLELLDAYRGAAEDQMTALDMDLAARRAHVRLLRLAGVIEQ